MKQEELEQVARGIFPHNKRLTVTASNKIMLRRSAFIKGVNWQQERSYSQEDLANALHSVELKDNKNYSKIHEGMKEWFEQFKKK